MLLEIVIWIRDKEGGGGGIGELVLLYLFVTYYIFVIKCSISHIWKFTFLCFSYK